MSSAVMEATKRASVNVDKILNEVTDLHEKITGRPYTGPLEGDGGVPVPTGADPVAFLGHEYDYLMGFVSSGALRSPFSVPYVWAPPAEVFETPKECCIRIDLPGVKRDDVTVKAHKHTLVLQGQRRFRPADTDAECLIMERAYGEFLKEIPLPETVDVHAIDAKLSDGVLEIRIPNKRLEREAKDLDVNIR